MGTLKIRILANNFLLIFFKKRINNFIPALLLELLIFQVIVTFLFYFYTFLLGRNILFLDILIFVLAVLIAKFVGYKLLSKKQFERKIISLGAGFILLLIIAIFTFYPPLFIV